MSDLLKKSRAAIGKRNRRAGKQFERKVAKRIAIAFGWNWKEAFDRAGSGHEQSHDAITLSPYSDQWPFWWECKYRQGWDFHQAFKNPETFPPYVWFREAIENTAINNLNPALVFSAPHKPVYIMIKDDVITERGPRLQFFVGTQLYSIYLLEDLLGVW